MYHRTIFQRLVPALLVFGASCIAVPPTRTSVGGVSQVGGDSSDSGVRFTTGAHTANASKNRAPAFDLGAGYIYERVDFDREGSGDHGTYVEASAPISVRGSRRLWFGGRGEVFWTDRSDESPKHGLAARLTIDHFLGPAHGSSVGDGDASWFYGSGSLEAFIEAGARTTSDSSAAGVVMLGIAIRAPAIFSIGVK